MNVRPAVTYLGPEGSHSGKKASIADTARVLGRMYDGIAFRGSAQNSVEELADHAEGRCGTGSPTSGTRRCSPTSSP